MTRAELLARKKQLDAWKLKGAIWNIDKWTNRTQGTASTPTLEISNVPEVKRDWWWDIIPETASTSEVKRDWWWDVINETIAPVTEEEKAKDNIKATEVIEKDKEEKDQVNIDKVNWSYWKLKDIISKKSEYLDTDEIIAARKATRNVYWKIEDLKLKQQTIAKDIQDRFSWKATSWFINAKIRKETAALKRQEQELYNEYRLESWRLKDLEWTAETRYQWELDAAKLWVEEENAIFERWIKKTYASVAEANAASARSNQVMNKLKFLQNSWWLSGLSDEEKNNLEKSAWLPSWSIDSIISTQDKEKQLKMLKLLWKSVSSKNVENILNTRSGIKNGTISWKEDILERDWITYAPWKVMWTLVWNKEVPIPYERAIKSQVPVQLMNSENELKALNSTIVAMNDAGLTVREAVLAFSWFNVDNIWQAKQAFKLIDEANKTVPIWELDLAWLANMITTWNKAWAVKKMEVAVNKAIKEEYWSSYIKEWDVKNSFVQIDKIIDFLNNWWTGDMWTPETGILSGFFMWQTEENRALGSMNSQLLWSMSKMFPNLSSDSLEWMLPSWFDDEDAYEEQLNTVKDFILWSLNSQRDWVLKKLTVESLTNYDKRFDDYQWVKDRWAASIVEKAINKNKQVIY